MALIDIEELEVTFGSAGRTVRALRGVSLSVEEGESFGIVGESGSGKSTVLRALCGLAPVTGGRILIDGVPVATPRNPGFYRRVQMVFQDPYASLHPRHTIDRVLSEPLAIHGFDRREARVEQALDEVAPAVIFAVLGDGFASVALGQDDDFNFSVLQLFTEGVGIIPFVGQ